MQRTLNLAGSVFKHPGHYIPVLQDCAGELAALRQLGDNEPAVLDRLMPMIQIVGGKSRKLTRDAIKGHVNRTYEAFGNDRPYYLDFVREDQVARSAPRAARSPSRRLPTATPAVAR